MEKPAIEKAIRDAAKEIKLFIRSRLEERNTRWKAIVEKHFNGDKEVAAQMLKCIMALPNSFED